MESIETGKTTNGFVLSPLVESTNDIELMFSLMKSLDEMSAVHFTITGNQPVWFPEQWTSTISFSVRSRSIGPAKAFKGSSGFVTAKPVDYDQRLT